MPLTALNRRDMVEDARLALWLTHKEAFYRFGTHGPSEIQHVQTLTHLGSQWLEAAWQPWLDRVGVTVRIRGIFCHQTPKAVFQSHGKTHQPELGDLLIVHEHVGYSARRRALLLQAKMSVLGKVSGAVDAVQKELYDNWPNFVLKGHGPAKSNLKYLDGERNHRGSRVGAMYAFVEGKSLGTSPKFYYGSCPWQFATPWGTGTAVLACAATYLTKMMLGVKGYGRRAQPLGHGAMHKPSLSHRIASNAPRGRHWDITVQELIDITGIRTLPHQARTQPNEPRGYITSFRQAKHRMIGMEIAGQLASGGRGPDAPDFPDLDDPLPGGVSTLLIETTGEALDLPSRRTFNRV